MKKSSFGEHHVELVIDFCPGLNDSCCRSQHGACSCDGCQVSSFHNCWRLAVDSDLEASRWPFDELQLAIFLYFGDSWIHVLRYDVASIQHAACDVLSTITIALHHLVFVFEQFRCQFSDRHLLMSSSRMRNQRGKWCERKMDSWIRHQICLELVHVDIKRTVETEWGCYAWYDLRYQSVQVNVSWTLDV